MEKENNKDSNYNIEINSATEIIYKISLSRIFALNKGPDVIDIKKLRYICNALGQNAFHN